MDIARGPIEYNPHLSGEGEATLSSSELESIVEQYTELVIAAELDTMELS